jgi:hypothetical protein
MLCCRRGTVPQLDCCEHVVYSNLKWFVLVAVYTQNIPVCRCGADVLLGVSGQAMAQSAIVVHLVHEDACVTCPNFACCLGSTSAGTGSVLVISAGP